MSEVQTSASVKSSSKVKAIVGGTIGNVVEWIDWAIYGLASPIIATQFFPKSDPMVGLMQTFAVFALGFLVRPLGAIVLGPYGDKYGRSNALSLSIILMAVGTGGIGLLPVYAQAGIWAPILLLLCRLIQGFATGAEWGTSTAFLYEYAPPNRRAFIGSTRPAGTGLGAFLGAFVLSATTTMFSPEVMSEWAWRIPFIFGGVIGLIGLYIRLRIDETPDFKEAQAKQEISEQPLKESFKNHKKGLLIVAGLGLSWNVVYYVLFVYLPTHIVAVVKVPMAVSMQINSIAALAYTIFILIVGWFADKYSKRLFLIASCVGFAIFSYPIMVMVNSGNYWTILSAQIFFGLLMALFSGPVPTVMAELFPTTTRNTSVSVAYNISSTIFGGTAPMVATYLVAVTNNPLSPAWYVIVSVLVTLVSVMYCKK